VEYNNVVSALLLDYPFLKDYDCSAVSDIYLFFFCDDQNSWLSVVFISILVALILHQ